MSPEIRAKSGFTVCPGHVFIREKGFGMAVQKCFVYPEIAKFEK
jgi:hypothetical protein